MNTSKTHMRKRQWDRLSPYAIIIHNNYTVNCRDLNCKREINNNHIKTFHTHTRTHTHTHKQQTHASQHARTHAHKFGVRSAL